MIQLSSFNVIHYRGIDGLSIPHLSRANLITGANGVGKTALIEAMWLFTGRYNPSLLWNINLQRNKGIPANPLSRLTVGDLEIFGVENGSRRTLKFGFEEIEGRFSNKRIAGDMREDLKRLPPVVGIIRTHLDGKLVKGGSESIHVTPSGSVLFVSPNIPAGRNGCVIESTRFQHETSGEFLNRYSGLVREGRKKELARAIDLVAPNVEEVEILTDEDGESYLSVKISDERPRPLHDLGGGSERLVRLLLGFSASQDAVLLSDELENGIHHSRQRKIWDMARQWMNLWNVQFVATTHSAELIDAAVDAFAGCPGDLAIHKLYRNETASQTEVATFTGDALAGARSLDLEVR